MAHFVFRKMHIYSNIKRIDCFDAWHHYSRACFYFYSVINETERSRTTTCDWIGRERKKRADYWNNYPSTRHICFFFLFVVVVRIIPTSGIQSNRDAVALTFDFRSFEREVFFFFFFFGLFFVEKVHLIIDNETSQGNREKKNYAFFYIIIYSVNKWEFIFVLVPHLPVVKIEEFYSKQNMNYIFRVSKTLCSSFSCCDFVRISHAILFHILLLLLLHIQNGEFPQHVMTGGAICKEYERKKKKNN